MSEKRSEEVPTILKELGYPDLGHSVGLQMEPHTYWMNMALLVSFQSRCVTRRVGAVVLDRFGGLLSTGANNPAENNCCQSNPDVPGMFLCGTAVVRGQGESVCSSYHAEYNALKGLDLKQIGSVYVTTAPCEQCVKLLLDTTCNSLFYWQRAPRSKLTLWDAQVNRNIDKGSDGHFPYEFAKQINPSLAYGKLFEPIK